MNNEYYEMTDTLIIPGTIMLQDFVENLNKKEEQIKRTVGIAKFHCNQEIILRELRRDGCISSTSCPSVTKLGQVIGLDFKYPGYGHHLKIFLNETAQKYILYKYPFSLFYEKNLVFLKGVVNYLGPYIIEEDLSCWLLSRKCTAYYTDFSGDTYIVPTQLGNTKGIIANSDIYGNPLFDKSSDTFDSILISPKAFEYIFEHLIDLEYFVDQRELYKELYG